MSSKIHNIYYIYIANGVYLTFKVNKIINTYVYFTLHDIDR
jgi:hypothetical protein